MQSENCRTSRDCRTKDNQVLKKIEEKSDDLAENRTGGTEKSGGQWKKLIE